MTAVAMSPSKTAWGNHCAAATTCLGTASGSGGYVKEIVIVDDGSRDGSAGMLDDWSAREPNIKLIRHGGTQGKGAAVITAKEQVTGLFVLIQDADLEY